ncbi:MAG: hypothetical protein JXA95_13640 [Spirochaetales bacterium]|nr:hypothetical protein [Spirochaetales bacterium]
MDDTPGEERLEASIKDGKIRVVMEGSKCEFTSPGHFPMPPGIKFSKNPNNKGEVTGGCIDSVQINGNRWPCWATR